jgi:hypothetical protein
MRTLLVRFFAAEDGSPVEGTASLLAGRWRTTVNAKQKPIHAAPELRFDVDDETVVNEVLVAALRRFPRFIAWPKADRLDVRLEKSGELILAVNHDAPRLVQVHATGGQETPDFLRSLAKDPHPLRSGQSINCSRLLPGPYAVEVFDSEKNPVAQLTVDLPAWRTVFLEVP